MSNYKPIILFRKKDISEKAVAFSICLFLILFIGLRPVTIEFGDMSSYEELYDVLLGTRFYFDWHTTNIIFDNLFNYLASIKAPIEFFFFILSVLYFSLMFLACKKMFHNDTLLAFVVNLAGFTTFAGAVNGVKAGVASTAFLVAFAYKEKKAFSIFMFLISYGFHHSMSLPICAYIITFYALKKNIDIKYFLLFWFFSLAMAALHITIFQDFLAGQTDAQGAKYLTAKGSELVYSGFRPDFILYSAIPIFIGYIIKKKYKINSNIFISLWCTYTLTNSIWLLCTYAAYTNRIASLSWLMYPFLLIYPFLLYKRNYIFNQYLYYTVYGHLGFLLFMNLIYY